MRTTTLALAQAQPVNDMEIGVVLLTPNQSRFGMKR